jgi:TRAP-type mannitol/chloroaromatic compound transport system substrate-binding protein
VPFGMNPEGMATWYFQSDGMKLWEETYAAFNLVPRPGVATGPQMAGWFRRKINTLGDYKGLKMRIPGLAARWSRRRAEPWCSRPAARSTPRSSAA